MRYTAKIDYNESNKALIKEAREWGKALGSYGFTITLRGSGSRSPRKRLDKLDLRRYDQSLPLQYAETVRTYINSKLKE